MDEDLAWRPGTLGALIASGGRGAPVSPAHFEEELKEKVFTKPTRMLGAAICALCTAASPPPLLAGVEELEFSEARVDGGGLAPPWAARSRAARSCEGELERMGVRRCGDGGVRRRPLRRGARAQDAAEVAARFSAKTRSASRGAPPGRRARARRGARAASSGSARSARIVARRRELHPEPRSRTTLRARARWGAAEAGALEDASSGAAHVKRQRCSTAPSSSRARAPTRLQAGHAAPGSAGAIEEARQKSLAAALEHAAAHGALKALESGARTRSTLGAPP